MKPKADRWIPVRRGDIYCSPGCGRGCTIDEHDFAQENAKLLCAELNKKKPGGWVPHVHENLGWFWSAINEKHGLRVLNSDYGKVPFSKTTFHAMVDPSLSVFYGPTKMFKDPHQAVRYTVRNAAAYGAEIADHVSKFTSYLK